MEWSNSGEGQESAVKLTEYVNETSEAKIFSLDMRVRGSRSVPDLPDVRVKEV